MADHKTSMVWETPEAQLIYKAIEQARNNNIASFLKKSDTSEEPNILNPNSSQIKYRDMVKEITKISEPYYKTMFDLRAQSTSDNKKNW